MDTNSKNNIRGTISPTAEKWIRGAAIFAMVIVALASAILSFDGLQKLALESQIPPNLSFLFPIAIDVTILMGSLAVLLYELFNLKAFFGWFTVLFGTALSVTGNVISVSDAGIVAQVLHGIIPILLCISLESLLRILRFNIRRTVESLEPLHEETNETNSEFQEPSDVILVSVDGEHENSDPEIPATALIEDNNEIETGSTLNPSAESPTAYDEKPVVTENNASLPVLIEDTTTAVVQVSKKASPAPTTRKKAAPSPSKPSNGKKERKIIPPLEPEERESLKELFNSFPTEHPTFKKLGEVLRVKYEIPLTDVRYILDYPEDKRVDSLMKNARNFISET